MDSSLFRDKKYCVPEGTGRLIRLESLGLRFLKGCSLSLLVAVMDLLIFAVRFYLFFSLQKQNITRKSQVYTDFVHDLQNSDKKYDTSLWESVLASCHQYQNIHFHLNNCFCVYMRTYIRNNRLN